MLGLNHASENVGLSICAHSELAESKRVTLEQHLSKIKENCARGRYVFHLVCKKTRINYKRWKPVMSCFFLNLWVCAKEIWKEVCFSTRYNAVYFKQEVGQPVRRRPFLVLIHRRAHTSGQQRLWTVNARFLREWSRPNRAYAEVFTFYQFYFVSQAMEKICKVISNGKLDRYLFFSFFNQPSKIAYIFNSSPERLTLNLFKSKGQPSVIWLHEFCQPRAWTIWERFCVKNDLVANLAAKVCFP